MAYDEGNPPGWHPVNQTAPYQPPAPPPDDGYDAGPPAKQSYHHAASSASTPPDPWAGVPAAVHDSAQQIVDKFLSSLGGITGYDANNAVLQLAKSGLNITGSPFDAYDWLFFHTISGSVAQANPWARFGMLKDEYVSKANSLNSVLADYTGSAFACSDVWHCDDLAQAIKGSWDPTQIRNFATYGNPQGTGPLLASAQLSGENPWLAIGQTYTQSLQGFTSFEQHAPSDKATLAAWFRFGQSAKQLGGGPEAIGQVTKELVAGKTTVR